MAHFAKIQTTQQGKNIILAGQNKQSVVFTKVELGDGLLDEGQSVDDMTALVHSVMSLPLQNFVNNGDGTARLRFVLDNNNLSKGFFNREIGVFAKVGDGTERLFAYTNAGNLADYIPGKESPISSKIINLHIIVGNAANLTIVAENSAYVTKLDMDGHKTQEVLDHPDGSVTTPKIRDEAVTGAKIAQASIEKKHLKKGGISAEDVGAYSKGETDEKIAAHRTAAELDHPDKSVRRKHLADNIYTLPAPEPADNTRFLRNDGTYQTITPNNIGAYHKSESYNKGEVDGRVNVKVSKSGDTMTGNLIAPAFETEHGYFGNYQRDTGDAITNNGGANVNIASWWGIGFYNTCTKKYTGTMDLRSGDWRTIGKIRADAGFEGTVTNANKLQNWSLQQILDEFLNVWHSNKAYTVGDITYHKNLPSWARLECVTAGTTGNNANVFSKNVKAGQYIQDGGVQWIIDDVRDGNRVGSITGSLYLPDGYIKANGATVQRADYPRLVALADKHNLWTNDAANNLGMFGRGNGSSTFVLPNWIDRMMQFAAQGGSTLAAGLPNITGQVGQGTDSMFNSAFCTGAFRGSAENSPAKNAAGGYRPIDSGYAVLDASKSNPIYGRSSSVQPAAIRLIPIIKY
ncbi:hypothetical protein [Selenomonas dianae]|uniref:Uncharacterized protein n=1 Tax=Selenomonas dianae TaxID=135079 RepID=A0ABN0TCC4_9FIRM|nr:hypothetical protein [Selenomonas dianae]WLD82620.1 hypothetical protein QU667_01130 [Selenomonas dianae]